MSLFLIAHKVRGEPAFDIAERCDSMGTAADPGPWWIIPTSGRRAYPYWSAPLELIAIDREDRGFDPLEWAVPELPDGLRDHYEATAGLRPQKIETIAMEDLL